MQNSPGYQIPPAMSATSAKKLQHTRAATAATVTPTWVPALHEAMQEAVLSSSDGIVILRPTAQLKNNRQTQCIKPGFEVAELNNSAATILQSTREKLLGQPLKNILKGTTGSQLTNRYASLLKSGHQICEDLRVDPRVFNAQWLEHHAVATASAVVVTLRDISARKREARKLHRQLLRDDLTGLLNRRGFLELAEQQIRLIRRNGGSAVVMYLDLNDFKDINDSFGHAAGDEVLNETGRILRSTLRDCDLIARMGGDEFTLLALDADQAGARVIQRRIESALLLANARGAFPRPVTASMGHACIEMGDDADLHTLLARADQLLYRRKKRRHLKRLHLLSRNAKPGARFTHAVTPAVSTTRNALLPAL